VSCTSPLEEDARAATRWRGERPRVALRCLNLHPVFDSYRTHPPVKYAPSAVAELDHWVNPWTGAGLYRPSSSSPKPYIVETEHWVRLAAGDRAQVGELWDWALALTRREVVRERFGGPECRAIVTYSPGMTEHFKEFLSPDLWPKLTHCYPSAPQQPSAQRPREAAFTILTVGNRFAEKGIPEALEAYKILRERHRDGVRMLLACRDLPGDLRLPAGVTAFSTHRMTEELKSTVYRAADVLLLPVYWDLVNSFAEAPAFGIPTITTRIHHGDAFVRHGATGYLLEPPVFAHSEGFGTRWRSRDDFVADIDARRLRGELRPLVEQAAELVEGMISGTTDHLAMGRAARQLHAERFAPEVRNARLMRLYARALEG
jgi:glycosyltransferase involved in cell wall biosynthesis